MDKAKLQEKVKDLKRSKEELIQKYASFQQELQSISSEVLRIEGEIRAFESLLKEEK